MVQKETDREGRELTPQAGGLASTDLQRIRQALDHSVSANTRAAYTSAWRSFQAWAQARAALPLPASPALVAGYLSHLAQERRLAVATVRLHRAALAAVHRAHGHPDPTDNEGVRRVLQGISRAHGRPQRQARPLTSEALAAVRATAKGRRPLGDGKRRESAQRASWRARVDVALLSVLRDGLLRRSEAAALAWGDVELRDDGSALLQVRRSKTDPTAKGGDPLHREGCLPGANGHPARPAAAGCHYAGLRPLAPADWPEGAGGGPGRRLGGGLHRSLR